MASKVPEELLLLDEWSQRLGLKDWYIVLETDVKPDELIMENSDGCVEYEETIKSARIQIIDEKLRSPSFRPFNFEETLVHELLHLKFCLLERGKNWEKKLHLRLLHQIIDDIARALVAAKNYKEKE